jgi:hypothetical protein
MPTVSVYVAEEIYTYLSQQSDGKAAMLAKTWLEERYKYERGVK